MTLETTVFQVAESQVVIAHYGGQVLSWHAADGIERLYTPDLLKIESGRALRGGVPVCFPQFADRGPVMKHGFARLLPWQVVLEQEQKIVLALTDNDYTRSVWNNCFRLEQHISLGERALCIELIVKNTGVQEFVFTNALHTYLRVENVLSAELYGLNGIKYEDALQAGLLKTEQPDVLCVRDELDRVYHSPPSQLQLMQSGQRTMLIEQEGFTDTVIWNPGVLKAAELRDMPTAHWQHMLCVEAAVAEKPISVGAGEEWRGMQRLVLI